MKLPLPYGAWIKTLNKSTGDAYCIIPSPLRMKNEKCHVLAMMLTVVGLVFKKKISLISAIFSHWQVLGLS